MQEMRLAMPVTDPELSIENLQRLIATMKDWSMKQPWTKAQTAAWRLRWFGKTPEQDAAAREEYQLAKFERERSGDFDRPMEREPFTDWPNGQGVYE
jgi:hypothetical protein